MPMKLKSITSIRSDAVVARSSRVIPTIYFLFTLNKKQVRKFILKPS